MSLKFHTKICSHIFCTDPLKIKSTEIMEAFYYNNTVNIYSHQNTGTSILWIYIYMFTKSSYHLKESTCKLYWKKQNCVFNVTMLWIDPLYSHCSMLDYLMNMYYYWAEKPLKSYEYIVACRSVARQWPRNKQVHNGRYYASDRKQQQRIGAFCAVHAEMS
jgi:hypothetical protein